MTSWLMAGAGVVALVAAPLGARWLVHWWHQENHAQHAAGAVVPASLPERDFYGSMTLAGEREIQAAQDQQFGTHFMLHGPAHRDPVCFWCGTEELEQAAWPADPVPYEDLQSDARIEDDRDGDQTAAWFHELGEDPGPGVDRPPPPGPVQDPPIRGDDQGRVVRAGAPNPRPAARADLTGSLSPRLPENDPGPAAHAGPGLERLADTDDIAQARGWPTVRDMDADVADAGRPWLDVQLEWLDGQYREFYAWYRGVLAECRA